MTPSSPGARLAPADRPKLRPHLTASPEPRRESSFILSDQVRVSDSYVRMGPIDLEIAKRLNGLNSLAEIHADLQARLGESITLPLARVIQFVDALEEALFLDSPAYRAVIQAPVRKPSCIGCYEGEPKAFREQMTALFAKARRDVDTKKIASDHRLKALIVPHMDYARGNDTYAHAYATLLERTNARLFVVLATSHYSNHPISLTRKDFQSPLGIIKTDQPFVERLAHSLGDEAFEDEIVAHFPEHSVELEAVLLHFLLHRRPDIRIVPIVLGGSRLLTHAKGKAEEQPVAARILAALKAAEEAANEPVCYLLSGDFAHIGPKFDDPIALDETRLKTSRQRDQTLLEALGRGSADDFLAEIAAEKNRRNVCGVAPFWYGLKLAQGTVGERLHYQQFVDPKGKESVSFAALAFA